MVYKTVVADERGSNEDGQTGLDLKKHCLHPW